MLAGLRISLNLRVSFGCLKDSLVSVSAAVMDIINPTPSNPAMLNSFSKTCKETGYDNPLKCVIADVTAFTDKLQYPYFTNVR